MEECVFQKSIDRFYFISFDPTILTGMRSVPLPVRMFHSKREALLQGTRSLEKLVHARQPCPPTLFLCACLSCRLGAEQGFRWKARSGLEEVEYWLEVSDKESVPIDSFVTYSADELLIEQLERRILWKQQQRGRHRALRR